MSEILDLASAATTALVAAGGGLVALYLQHRLQEKKGKQVTDSAEFEHDGLIHDRLKLTLNALGCDRVGLFQIHNGDKFLGTNSSFKKVSNTHEAVAPGVSEELPTLQSIPQTVFSSALLYLKDNRFLFIEEVPSAKSDPIATSGLLKMRGVMSIYKVPIKALNNKIIAFITAEWVHSMHMFDDADVKVLEETAAMVSGYLMRHSKR